MLSYWLYLLQVLNLNIFVFIAAIIDAKTKKIPNWIILELLCFWLFIKGLSLYFVLNQFLDINLSEWIQDFMTPVLYGIIVLLFLLGVIFLSKKLFRTTENFFGMGDIKLLFSITLYVGLMKSLFILTMSSVLFCMYVLFRRLLRRDKSNTAAFAPFICIGVIILSVVTINI